MSFFLPEIKMFAKLRRSMNQPAADVVLVEVNWYLHIDVGRYVGVKRRVTELDESSD
jgi:hypothetical protein